VTAVLWFEFALGGIAGFATGALVSTLYWARRFRTFTHAVERMAPPWTM